MCRYLGHGSKILVHLRQRQHSRKKERCDNGEENSRRVKHLCSYSERERKCRRFVRSFGYERRGRGLGVEIDHKGGGDEHQVRCTQKLHYITLLRPTHMCRSALTKFGKKSFKSLLPPTGQLKDWAVVTGLPNLRDISCITYSSRLPTLSSPEEFGKLISVARQSYLFPRPAH